LKKDLHDDLGNLTQDIVSGNPLHTVEGIEDGEVHQHDTEERPSTQHVHDGSPFHGIRLH
jgi:hypothetical protein